MARAAAIRRAVRPRKTDISIKAGKQVAIAVAILGASVAGAQDTATGMPRPAKPDAAIVAPAPSVPASSAGAASTPQRAVPNDVVVTAKHRRHRVMRFLFGPNRRRGGFFANLFHRHGRKWTSSTYRRACKRRFRSYDPRTNRYRAYSGVRRVCVL